MSRAPIINGNKIVSESESRIRGIATKKIIVVPCIVNIRLKTWGETKVVMRPDELETHDGYASRPPINKNTSA